MQPALSILPAALPQPFKRAALGLFHGKSIQHGNNVPHSLKKTRRTWLPNVHTKTLLSPLLGRRLQVKVTARALRTINKHGGLDQYLLNTSPSLLGDEGMRLRLLVREQFDAQNALEAKRAQRAAEIAAKDARVKQTASQRMQRQKEDKARKRLSEVQGGLVKGLFGEPRTGQTVNIRGRSSIHCSIPPA